ncbi:hypothetical protein FHT86_006208 [Rhizobium sp. BK313]|nr:hypothetical protein [Rhizobium sp. BK313]
MGVPMMCVDILHGMLSVLKRGGKWPRLRCSGNYIVMRYKSTTENKMCS